MSNNAVTRITISAERDDPLESVRKAVVLADEMVAMGGKVKVTGDLFFEVKFDASPHPGEDKPDEPA